MGKKIATQLREVSQELTKVAKENEEIKNSNEALQQKNAELQAKIDDQHVHKTAGKVYDLLLDSGKIDMPRDKYIEKMASKYDADSIGELEKITEDVLTNNSEMILKTAETKETRVNAFQRGVVSVRRENNEN